MNTDVETDRTSVFVHIYTNRKYSDGFCFFRSLLFFHLVTDTKLRI